MGSNGHLHGFGPWVGSGEDYKQEHLRRPGVIGSSGGSVGPGVFVERQAFITSKLPPMMTGHWLLKRDQVAGTWEDPAAAVEWLTGWWKTLQPMEGAEGRHAYPCVEEKIPYALDALGRGVDVTWCYWTRTRMLVSYSVVACANRFFPKIPCPAPVGSAAAAVLTRGSGADREAVGCH